jgi:hypothetical protein
MIIYVNGDSHSAAGEAMNSYCFAKDDPKYWALGREPHPDNIAVSYGKLIADRLGAELHVGAESASSNDRIIRTTNKYLKTYRPDLIIIGWSTWEREEFLHNKVYWQVNAGGVGEDWPDSIKIKYAEWIKNVDPIEKEQENFLKIWKFNYRLRKIPHLFFNCYLPFTYTEQLDWGDNYVNPYDKNSTYFYWLKKQGFKTVNPHSYHYGPDGHAAWSEHLMPYLTKLL